MAIKRTDLAKLVSTYELPPIEGRQQSVFGSLCLSVNVIQLPSKKYGVRVFIREKANVEPVYSEDYEGINKFMTIDVKTEDYTCNWEEIEGITEEDVLAKALDMLNHQIMK